jgi:hypothetical protein
MCVPWGMYIMAMHLAVAPYLLVYYNRMHGPGDDKTMTGLKNLSLSHAHTQGEQNKTEPEL